MGQSINVDVDYFDNLKTRRLVGLLKKGSEVVPLRLWTYTGKFYAESGRLEGHSVQEIEAAVGWWGTPGVAVDALVRVGFLDLDGATYVVHDWADHNGHIHAYSERGKAGAAARWAKVRAEAERLRIEAERLAAEADASGNAQAMLKQCSNEPTNENTPNPPQAGAGKRRLRDGKHRKTPAERAGERVAAVESGGGNAAF